MPGPAVYVVAAAAVVGGVVAAITFKEFVYDPVIAPKFKAWRDSRQRRLEPPMQNRRRPSTPPGSGHASDSDDDADKKQGLSVEMRDLVRSETAEWRGVSEDTTLRRRTNRTTNVLDESNVFLPFDPISPTTMTPSTTAPSSPPPEETRLRTPPAIQTPLPRHPLRAEALHAAIEHHQTSLPTPQTTPGPSPPPPRQLYSPSASSDSTQSSFTPAVIGPRSDTAFSDGGRSTTFDIVSPPPRSPFTSPPIVVNNNSHRDIPSPVTSPFAHIHHPLSPSYVVRPPSPQRAVSPRMLNSPPISSLHVPSESDFAILSPDLRSGMFSDTDSSFGGSDLELESEMSAWESVGDRTPNRTPSPPSPHS
ncbi:hypothetical protein BC629DRAFT_1505586 [Irpex lacteus]|nr:hypothetical protein BC629DRAFT_1505586 [Irpex lacteus]